MFIQIQNAGSAITLKGVTYNTGSWVDITHFMAYQSLDGTTNAVDGPNAGRSIDNGTMIRDLLGYKEKIPFVSIPMPIQDCQALKKLIKQSTLKVRTDYFEGTQTNYSMYPGATVTLSYVQKYADGSEYAKLSFSLIEI